VSADAWRSTAEARWAAFFTEIGWSYDYEYGTFGNYLPDFLLSTTGTNGIICEVKGGASSFDDLVGQAHKLWAMRDRLDHPILLALPNRPRKAWRPFNGKRLPFACGAVWSYKAGAQWQSRSAGALRAEWDSQRGGTARFASRVAMTQRSHSLETR
jgi:hypothetical protein